MGDFVLDQDIKRPDLEIAVRKCDLSPVKFNVLQLRTLISSLNRNKLPLDVKEVSDELVRKHKEDIHGCRSPQQRSLKLIYKLDPHLVYELGKKVFRM